MTPTRDPKDGFSLYDMEYIQEAVAHYMTHGNLADHMIGYDIVLKIDKMISPEIVPECDVRIEDDDFIEAFRKSWESKSDPLADVSEKG